MLLAEGAPAVLVVIAEDQTPAVYGPWVEDVGFPYAVALVLKPGQGWQLSLETADESGARTPHPHAIELIRALLDGRHTCTHQWSRRQWTWQRTR